MSTEFEFQITRMDYHTFLSCVSMLRRSEVPKVAGEDEEMCLFVHPVTGEVEAFAYWGKQDMYGRYREVRQYIKVPVVMPPAGLTDKELVAEFTNYLRAPYPSCYAESCAMDARGDALEAELMRRGLPAPNVFDFHDQWMDWAEEHAIHPVVVAACEQEVLA